MRSLSVRVVAGICAVAAALAAVPIFAQDGGTAPPPEQAAAPYSAQELDQLLSPIALYPDPLLAQILMGATYPLEIVMAARWVREPDNAALKGDALTAALDREDWAPSVKSLVQFPQILQMMDARLDWTERLGNAFLAQQPDVMDAVQRLRRLAQQAGNLPSDAQQTVTEQDQTIVIEPADPQVVYVPVYNPTMVFGPWPYPAYPPLYFPPPPGLYVGAPIFPGFGFTVGIATIGPLWGWEHFEWQRHHIAIDPDRYERLNRHHPPIRRDTWVHEPEHRHGVPYPTPGLRSRFEPLHPGPLNGGRDFRGYRVQPRPPAPAPAPQRNGGQHNGAKAAPQRRAPPPRAGEVPRTGARPPGALAAPPLALSPPPAFEDYSRGDQVQREERRGRDSRLTMPGGTAPGGTAAPPPHRARPQTHGGAGGHTGGRR